MMQLWHCTGDAVDGVWMATLHRTWRTTVSRPPVLTLGCICTPSAVSY